MAKTTRKTKKKTKRDWAGYGRIALRGASILLLVVLAFSLVFSVDRLRTHAESRLLLAADASASERVGAFVVEFTWPTLGGDPEKTWMRPEDMDALRRVAAYAVDSDVPLSVAPLRKISERLGGSGWFVGEPRVSRVGPGLLRVEGRWRDPSAVVRWNGFDHLVSDEAMPMPIEVPAGGLNLPYIAGVRNGADVRGPARYANPWPGPAVRVGLEIIAVLRSGGVIDEVAGVDVGSYLDGGAIELVSLDGNRVVWGAPVDDWPPGEPSTEDKIGRLKQLIARTGSIDAGQPRLELHRARVEIDRTGSQGLGGGASD